MDVSSLEASRISAQTIVSSVTFAASSFYDGNASSGVITVVDYLQLSSAAATGTLTVATSSAADGMYVIVGGQKFTNGTNFIMRTSSMVSAYNLGVVIAAALPTWTVTYSSLTTSAIALTAPYGLNYNNYALYSSAADIVAGAATMSGGQDNATISINGTSLQANKDFYCATSTAVTASLIMTAINANAVTSLIVGASTSSVAGSTGKVTLWSLKNGVNAYALAVSTTGMTLSSSTMLGGTDPYVILNSSSIYLPAHGFVTSLAVLYSTASSNAPGPLVTGTTYYIGAGSGTNFVYLSTTAALSQTGTYLMINSTTTQHTKNTFTLTPLSMTGAAPIYTWQSSNDGVNFATNSTGGAVTISTAAGTTDTLLDFSNYNYKLLRLSFTAPTTGAIKIQSILNIKQDGIGRF